jgi:hypothetical protein
LEEKRICALARRLASAVTDGSEVYKPVHLDRLLDRLLRSDVRA